MANENEQADVEIVEEDLSQLDDTTDWKAKAQELEQKRREDGIRARERTKALKERLTEFESKVALPPAKKDETKSDEFGLLQKTYLRAAGIIAEDEIELAKEIQKKTGVEWDRLVDDDYFTMKLEGLRTKKANAEATSNIRGGSTPSQGKQSEDYWTGKGEYPSPEQVPDRKLRAKIAKKMFSSSGDSKKYYND